MTTMRMTTTRTRTKKKPELHRADHERGPRQLASRERIRLALRQVAAAEPDPRKRRLFLQLAQPPRSRRPMGQIGDRAFIISSHARARIVARLVRRWVQIAARRTRRDEAARPIHLQCAAVRHPATRCPPRSARWVHATAAPWEAICGPSVFGVNDGLVSNASLVMGVAGAGVATSYVLMTGIAGLLAGALSMAAGEYVSVRSQREMYEYQIALERDGARGVSGRGSRGARAHL